MIRVLDVIEGLEDRLRRVNLLEQRVCTSEERAFYPNSRFSILELIDLANYAALEIVTEVKSDHLLPLIGVETPVWDFSDSLRILGSTARVEVGVPYIANRVTYDYVEDIRSRGDSFTDTTPVYTTSSDEFKIIGDTEDPSGAKVDVVLVPKDVSVLVSGGAFAFDHLTGELTSTLGFTDYDLGIPVGLSNGDYGWIKERISSTKVKLYSYKTFSTGSFYAGFVRPLFMYLPENLTGLVIELAAADMFAMLYEIAMSESCMQDYRRKMDRYKLSLFDVYQPEGTVNGG